MKPSQAEKVAAAVRVLIHAQAAYQISLYARDRNLMALNGVASDVAEAALVAALTDESETEGEAFCIRCLKSVGYPFPCKDEAGRLYEKHEVKVRSPN